MAKYLTQGFILGPQVLGRAFTRTLGQEFKSSYFNWETKKLSAFRTLMSGSVSLSDKRNDFNFDHMFCTKANSIRNNVFEEAFNELNIKRCLNLLKPIKVIIPTRDSKANKKGENSRAAVLVPLCLNRLDEPFILHTQRSVNQVKHRGEVGFPRSIMDDMTRVNAIIFETSLENKLKNEIIVPNLNQSLFKYIRRNDKLEENIGNVSKELPPHVTPNKIYADYKRIIIRNPYSNMYWIRHRKMKKHQLRKRRKKMLALIKKILLRRNIKKEKLFRAELLAQIKEAEEFDAELYVKNILQTIDSVPKEETAEEKIERIRDLIRKNRQETTLIAPKFED